MDTVATQSLALQIQLGSGPGINATGPYNALTAYAVNDSATLGGNTYVCTSAVTGGTGPGVDTAHWVLGLGVAQASTILSLSAATIAGARTLVQARLANRVSLLAAASNPAALPLGSNVSLVAQTFNECQTANSLLGAALSLDAELSPLKATDSTGKPLATFIAGIPSSAYPVWSNALIANATTFETLEAQPLLLS
jgi:hypothetical protein